MKQPPLQSGIRAYTPEERGGLETLEPRVGIQKQESPGFLRSVGLAAGLSSDIPAIGSAIYAFGQKVGHMNDSIPEGWHSWGEDFSDVPTDYIPYVMGGTTPWDVQNRKKNVLSELKAYEELSNGSGLGAIIGTGIGALASVSTAIPIAAGAKFATAGAGFLKNMARQAPGIAAQAVVRNGIISATSATQGTKEWAINSLVETAISVPLVGAISAVPSLRIGAAKELLKKRFGSDIEYLAEATAEGEFKGYKAVPANPELAMGDSAGAMRVRAEVERAQEFIDYGLTNYGESPIFRKIFGMSPVVRGLTSKYATTRKFVGEMFQHNMVTERGGANGTAEGSARVVMSGAIKATRDIKTIYWESMGIKGPLKDLQANLSKGISPTEYLQSVGRASSLNGKADWIVDELTRKMVEDGADVARKAYDSLYTNELVRTKLLPPNLTPVGALSYVNRVYNKGRMAADQDGFMNSIIEGLAFQNERIRSLREPLFPLEEELKTLKTQLKGTKGETRSTIKKSIENTNKRLEEAKGSIQQRIDAGEFANELEILTERPTFTETEIKEFREFQEPFTQAKNEIKDLVKRVNDKSLSKEERKLSRLELKGKRESYKEMQNRALFPEEFEGIREPIKFSEGEGGHLLEGEIETKEFKLAGKFDERFYFPESRARGKLKFKDLEARPFLRKITPEAQFPAIAERLYNRIMQETPEQQMARMSSPLMGGGGFGSPVKARTNMVNERFMEPYLERNIDTLIQMHAGWVGKHAGIEDAFQRMGTNSREGMTKILTDLKQEYDIQKSKVTSEKEALKLKKEYDKEVDYLKTAEAIYWGTFRPGAIGGETGRKISAALRSLKNYAAGTMLGNLPFLQGAEFFANAMHHGVWPTIQTAVQLTGSSFRKLARQEAADAYLALNTFSNAMFDQVYGAGAEYIGTGMLERVSSNIAKFGMNASGANWIADGMETISTVMSSNRSYRNLKALVEGKTLRTKDLERLNQLGLSDRNIAERIIRQFESHGQPFGETGSPSSMVSNLGEWNDYGAAKAFRMSIQKEVRATILKPNMLDVPLTFRNEFLGTMTQFMSYSFAATNSFLIPTLQKPDAEKLLAMTMMIGIGSLVPILRQVSRGEEPELNPTHLLTEGIINSGVLGIHMHLLTIANSVFDVPGLRDLQPDRFRKEPLDLIGGPVGGMMNSLASVVQMGISGQINESGVKRARNLAPSILHNWYTTHLTNSLIESMGLPRNKSEATNWFGEFPEPKEKKPRPKKLFEGT